MRRSVRRCHVTVVSALVAVLAPGFRPGTRLPARRERWRSPPTALPARARPPRAGARCPVTTGTFPSPYPSMSADGAYVAFISGASNLVKGQQDPGSLDVFLFERGAGRTTLVSHVPESPTMVANSASGRHTAHVHDLTTRCIEGTLGSAARQVIDARSGSSQIQLDERWS